MKQILQDIKGGDTRFVEIPQPQNSPGKNLIKSKVSLISAGTERMLIDFGKAGYLAKARQQPEKVKMVLDKIKTDGLLPTIDAVRSKLDQPLPLGYSNVGEVIEGNGELTGKRMVSNGNHAEIVSVPCNLCAEVPENVSDEEAAFTVLGSIALQGIRLANPTLGETFVVTGLGLVGQLTVQLLMANGCRVVGIDLDSNKCDLAASFGARSIDLAKGENPVSVANELTNENGVDGVIITADTKSSDPVHQAAQMCRKRGRIVLVGVTGLELNRSDFYEKELSFQVSCSYGPGRYDPEYEQKGNDYPFGFVRWTEQRNFQAVLQLMQEGKLDVKRLISHRYSFEDALKAYELMADNKEPYLGILLSYPNQTRENADDKNEFDSVISLKQPVENQSIKQKPTVAVLGAGSFTSQVILPNLRKSGVNLRNLVSSGGISSTYQGEKHGFELSSTDTAAAITDPDVDAVFVTTRHNSHYRYVKESLEKGKHVFVEKPLCLTKEELDDITTAYWESVSKKPDLKLMVGFNRRFAPHVLKMRGLLEVTTVPVSMIMTVNAGYIAKDHWTQDPEVGGGRIVGEVCHFVDLLRFLAKSRIVKTDMVLLNKSMKDTLSINLKFENDSIGTIHYFANGNKGFPKERLDLFCEGKILQLNNFKTLKGYGWSNFSKMKLWKQDKGHADGLAAFLSSIKNGEDSPIPINEIMEVMETTLNLAEMSHRV